MGNPIKIEVVEDTIVLHGQEEESAGKILQGVLILDLNEPTKVRSVMLKFYGKMKVSWTEGHTQNYHQQERSIIDHKWQFLPEANDLTAHSRKSYTIPAGRHTWDFALTLPGDLPQSVEATNGKVVYQLKAIVDRPFLLQNFSFKRTIQIIRTVRPSELSVDNSWEVHNTWEDKVEYNITIPTRVYCLGDTIPITFEIRPLAGRLRVRRIAATLKEYCIYTAHESSTRHAWVCAANDKKHCSPEDKSKVPYGGWTHTLPISIPKDPPLIHCDSSNEMMRIHHRVKMAVHLLNVDGQASEVRCAAVILLVSALVQETNSLPPYQPVSYTNARQRQRLQQLQQQQMPEINLRIWWHGMEISRVPSYNTAAQQEPALLSSSLPPYEAHSFNTRR
ncbi:hypothetical protein BX666DRAFT_1868265 [Dichotomocladium elegans]|nr:hypothetical protein BX666DRAFT_1868265 [Dichotomocladium elegans]